MDELVRHSDVLVFLICLFMVASALIVNHGLREIAEAIRGLPSWSEIESDSVEEEEK